MASLSSCSKPCNHHEPSQLNSGGKRCLLHRMPPEHIPFSVAGQRNETIFTDGKFFSLHAPAGFHDASSLDGAIGAIEINQSAVSAGCETRHFDQCTGASHSVLNLFARDRRWINPETRIGEPLRIPRSA